MPYLIYLVRGLVMVDKWRAGMLDRETFEGLGGAGEARRGGGWRVCGRISLLSSNNGSSGVCLLSFRVALIRG
jgi:hypothetical protein